MKKFGIIFMLLALLAGLSPLAAQDASAAPEAAAVTADASAAAPAAPEAAAPAAVVSTFSGASTAWLLVATALVLFMTMPGLGMFYGGLVKRKNVLSVLMQSFAIMGVVTIVWFTVGYSLVFSAGDDLIPGFLGNFSRLFMTGVGPDTTVYALTSPVLIPELVFSLFQCMFAVITPALIIGAFAERMKFSSFLVFTIAWLLLVYVPIAHSVWNVNGFFFKAGALDYAGGTVVHINAGIAALVAALMLGKRKSLKPNPPHNLTYTILGAALLWFGWFGFNAGSGLAADGMAASAFFVTHLATAVAAVTWIVIDWIVHRKPTILGAATGAVAGLVAITPAAGFVAIEGAFAIGIATSVFCWFFVSVVKPKFGYDDTLDAFGVHGIGGIVGALMTGIFASPLVATAWHPDPASGIVTPWIGILYNTPENVAAGLVNPVNQLLVQAEAVGFTLLYSGIVTFLIMLIIKVTMGLRVSEKDEAVGLDISQHNERAYTVIE